MTDDTMQQHPLLVRYNCHRIQYSATTATAHSSNTMKALIIARSAAALHVMLHSLTLSQSFSPPVTLLTPGKALAWNSRNNYHSFHRRNNAALLWSHRLLVTSMLASGSTSSISRKYRHQKEHKLLPTLLLRGGGGGGDGNNSGSDDNRGRSLFRHLSIGRRGRRGLYSSSAIAATTNQLDASDSTDIIDKEAQASLSIVGLSVKTSTMEDIPYLNTKKCDEFRVLFVLGGPGAGTCESIYQQCYPSFFPALSRACTVTVGIFSHTNHIFFFPIPLFCRKGNTVGPNERILSMCSFICGRAIAGGNDKGRLSAQGTYRIVFCVREHCSSGNIVNALGKCHEGSRRYTWK